MSAERKLILTFVSPPSADGVGADIPYTGIECDSVRLCVRDGEKGRGGGSAGIRPGHIKSLISLDKGQVEGFRGGERVISVTVSGGFAAVGDDLVTIIAESITK